MNVDLSIYQLNFQQKKNKACLFDPVRKKWIIATPEECVRQQLIKYLKTELHYPNGLIAVEKEFNVIGLRKRFDLMLYNKDQERIILIECKSPKIKLDESVVTQILVYNKELKVPYLMVTNGIRTLAAHITTFEPLNLEWVKDLPEFFNG